MQRIVLCAVSALALLGLACPAQASTFSDVPTDHWAYEAIDYLYQAGLVEGYPDNTFRGERAFTRYEMAMVIARVFTKIQDWQAMTGNNSLPTQGEVDLSEVYARLDRLADEFRNELADLGARITSVEDEQVRLRSEVTDLKALIKDSGLSGDVRFRVGGFINTGSSTVTSEIGYETRIRLCYFFQPDPNLDFKLALTATEIDGPSGTGFIPGVNNETETTNPTGLPSTYRNDSSSFIIDEAYIKYHFCNAPKFLGSCPTITGGRQYFSEGEFGLAGDNFYRSNFGVRFDTSYGANWDAYAGLYRTSAISKLGPWSNADTYSYQASGVTTSGDDFMLAGLEYHSGEGCIPGHEYKLVLRLDGTYNGFGAEQYVGISGNAEIPWLSDKFLNGIRGEWIYMPVNVSGRDPEADLGLTPWSIIGELDLYNDVRTRVSVAYALMGEIAALPVLANVDNDPFSEWDYTVNQTRDAFNLSRQHINYFPADFSGFGLQAKHIFKGKLHAVLTGYYGDRIDATASDRPAMVKLHLRYPFTNNSSFALDLVHAGERSGFEDPISLVRGEYKVHF